MRASRHIADANVVALRTDVATLREDLEKLTSTLAGLVDHQIARSKATAEELRRELETSAEKGMNWLESSVQEKPAQACAIALGAGFIAAMMLTRRH